MKQQITLPEIKKYYTSQFIKVTNKTVFNGSIKNN